MSRLPLFHYSNWSWWPSFRCQAADPLSFIQPWVGIEEVIFRWSESKWSLALLPHFPRWMKISSFWKSPCSENKLILSFFFPLFVRRSLCVAGWVMGILAAHAAAECSTSVAERVPLCSRSKAASCPRWKSQHSFVVFKKTPVFLLTSSHWRISLTKGNKIVVLTFKCKCKIILNNISLTFLCFGYTKQAPFHCWLQSHCFKTVRRKM